MGSPHRTSRYLLVLISTGATAFTLILTGYAAYISTSATLYADFIKCFVEFIAIALSFAVVEKTRRTDLARYNYGFGKLEQLSSTVVAFAMFCSAMLCVGTAVHHAFHPEPVQNILFGLGLGVLSVLGNGYMWWRFSLLFRHDSSPVTSSQKALYLSKMLASFVVVASLSLSLLWKFSPIFLYADALGSLAIASFLIYSAYTIASDSVEDLVDRSVDEAAQMVILKSLVKYENVYEGYHGMRTRRIGTKKLIQINLSFHDNQNMAELRPSLRELKSEIEGAIPESEVVISVQVT